MTRPDFEVNARLRARRLGTRVSPDPETVGEEVTVERHELRSGLPDKMEPGKQYGNVAVEKRVLGELGGR